MAKQKPRAQPVNDLQFRTPIFLEKKRFLKMTFQAKRLFFQECKIAMEEVLTAWTGICSSPGIPDTEKFKAGKRVLTDERLVCLLWTLLLDEDPTLQLQDVPALMEACPFGDGNIDEQEGYIVSAIVDAFYLRRGLDLNAPALKKKKEERIQEAMEEKRKLVEAIESGEPSTSEPTPDGSSSSTSQLPSSATTSTGSGD